MPLTDKTRKILHILCIAVCVFFALTLLYEVAMQIIVRYMLDIYDSAPSGVASGDIGIIGGADGPTAILVGVATVPSNAPLVRQIVYLVVVILSGIGIFLTRKKTCPPEKE